MVKINTLKIRELDFYNSNLPLNIRVKSLISLLTLEEKISLLPTRQAAIPRLNIKEYSVGGEAAHGVVSDQGPSTVFPQPLGLAATFDKNLLKNIGNIIGDEARIYYDKCNRKYGLTLWAPTIDMERNPLWGRTEEAYGEDPILAGTLASNLIQGMQGNDDFYIKLVASPKHFYGNNNEEDRIFCSSSIDKRNKNEYYLKPFELAFTQGKAKSMMTAYNSINGRPAIVNNEVQNIVKDKWGCDGFIVCDGGDFSQTVEYHKYYKTHAETIANALIAGIDCFTDDAPIVINAAKEALERNLITETHINKAIENIFKIRFRLGEFDDDAINPYSNISPKKLCSNEHSMVALEAALKSIILLKNENNILPLCKSKLKNISILGPLADVIYKDWYCGTAPYNVTFLQGMKEHFKDSNIAFHNGNDLVKFSTEDNNEIPGIYELSDWGYESINLRNTLSNKFLTLEEDDITISDSSDKVWGWFVKELFKTKQNSDDKLTLRTWDNEKISLSSKGFIKNVATTSDLLLRKTILENGIEQSVKLASNSDLSIVVVGNHPLINGKEEIDRTDLNLAKHQEKLIQEVYKANPNTIVIIVGSYPFSINWCNDNIPAILYSTHGCQELGNALAMCLAGEYNPAGRLPITWYKSVDQLPSIMNYDIINNNSTYMYFDGDPLYEFGYGLSYSDFKYSNLIISSNVIKENDSLTIDVLVENTSLTDGEEVIQLYASLTSTRVKRPIKQLLNFDRVMLKAGECRWISFTINSSQLKYYDVNTDNFILESGECKLLIGSSSKNIHLKKNLTIIANPLLSRDLTSLTSAENYDSCFNILLDESKISGSIVITSCNTSWLKYSDVIIHNKNTFVLDGYIDENSTIELVANSITGNLIGLITPNNIISSNIYNSYECKINTDTNIDTLYIITKGICKINTFKFI